LTAVRELPYLRLLSRFRTTLGGRLEMKLGETKLGKGLLLAGTLAFIATGCASGGGGTSMGPASAGPSPQASAADGEREREDQFTRAAQDFLDDGFAQETLGQQASADLAFGQALDQARQAVAADPTNPRAQILLGEAAIATDNYAEGGEAYAEALELRPAYIDETRGVREQAWLALYNEGVPFINAGDYPAVIEIYSAADQIYGERPEIKVVLGQLLASEGEYDRAIEVMQAARSIIEGPRIEEVDSATARSWREQADDIDPTIAQSLLQLERYADAIPVLQSLADQYPDDLQYVFSLATAYQETDQDDQAIALYNQVAERPGLQAADYLELGFGLYRMEEYLGAHTAFRQASDAAPNDRDALELGVNSLQVYYVDSDSLEASPAEVGAWVDMAERWIELDPNSDRAYIALAQGLIRQGDESRNAELLNAAEALPVVVRNLQMTRTRSGATVVGSALPRGDDAPEQVTIEFTFYDAAGTVLGTETAQLTFQGGSAGLNVQFQGEGVEGYGYEIIG
jgi:tetratricopeptide (TPR) repeat protein